MADLDRLCHICAEIDLFSLFTGPRYFPHHTDGEHRVSQKLGTLKEIKANARCPLCRLVKHNLYGSVDAPIRHPWDYFEREPDDAKVQCALSPIRSDYDEDMEYKTSATRDLIATKMRIYLHATPDCSQDESDLISHGSRSYDFQLLSPDSVDPARPLMNGFPITTMKKSLTLLSQWFQTCRDTHKETCHLQRLPITSALDEISNVRVIDVQSRTISERNLADTEYAALSYVWGEDREAYMELVSISTHRLAGSREIPVPLPSDVPKVIEDALYVCTMLSIPYLWVDLYCIDQGDTKRKAAEINAMGQIYRLAQITLIDGHMKDWYVTRTGQRKTRGLLPEEITDSICSLQRIETIGDQKYISSLPGTTFRLHASEWVTRSWTYQEGNLAKRVALFNNLDVTFMCGSGAWCESRHSGKYGHRANLSQLDLRSSSRQVLSANDWLQDEHWDFKKYNSILMAYTGRQLSFESDKLNAISGCFNIIAQKKGLHFIYGLPSADFHYALLWSREYDRPRDGFPSWSWAGWHSLQQFHWLYPREGTSGSLVEGENPGVYEYQEPPSLEIELAGSFICGVEQPHRPNRCLQRPSRLQVCEELSTIKITSEIAHFSVEIVPSNTDSFWAREQKYEELSPDFDSATSNPKEVFWDAEKEYHLRERLVLRTSAGHRYAEPSPVRYRPWPQLRIGLPSPLRGSTITRVLRDGIDLVNIIEIKMLEGDAGGDPLPSSRVFCVGVDRSQGRARRFGTVHMTSEMWKQADPNITTIELS